MTQRSPFCYFKKSPEIVQLAVMLYVRFPLSLRNVEDLLHERGVDVSYESVRYCGGIGLALNLQARSKSEEQGVCSQATVSGTWMKSL